MRHLRDNKGRKALQRMKDHIVDIPNHNDQDKTIFDLVLKSLYENAHKTSLHLEGEIFSPHNVKLNRKDADRIWNIITGSGWVVPSVGFGNAGKLELTKAGYQFMIQFGSYKQYLDTVESQLKQQQTIVVPISIQEDSAMDKPIEISKGKE